MDPQVAGLQLPMAAVPAAFVPIRLPWTRLPSLETSMPSPLLPEITLPAAAPVPPIVLFDALVSITTPVPLPGPAAVPLTSVPKKLPVTRLPFV